MSDLDYYAQRAKRYTMDQLTWALGDIQATLAIWQSDLDPTHPYMRKLYDEFDAYVCEKYKRLNKVKRMTRLEKLGA